MLLEIKDLNVNYGADNILDGFNLELAAGESLAVIGESGTGKTTLGLSIMGLTAGQIRGDIQLDGRSLLSLTEEQMRAIRWNRVAMVFQNTSNVLNPVHPVLAQVAEPMIAHGRKNKEHALAAARELLHRFGLPSRCFSAFPHRLSGGEQQRILLAMALANDPALLILDEPLSSLDGATRMELVELLKENNSGRARLVITHDLDTAGRLADKVAVLYGGRFVEKGPVREVFRRPRHPYTRALLRAYPNMNTVKDLQGIKGKMTRPVTGCPFHPRCTQAIEICRTKKPPLSKNNRRETACHRGGIVTLLATENLGQFFGRHKAVNAVNLRIEAGETLALVGRSGSGKTTLAKTIMGLYPPSAGAVYLEGRPVTNRGQNFYRKVQMVFQNPGESLSHRLTVLQAVMEPLVVQNIGSEEERRNRAVQALGEVELPQEEDFLQKYPHQLSGGEAQRVAVARALVLDPALLIADEPTAFLDAGVGTKILKLLLNLQEKRGLSMLYITHDPAAARKVSDRIAVMLDGEIIEEGPAGRIAAAPEHAYTKRLLAAAPTLSQSF